MTMRKDKTSFKTLLSKVRDNSLIMTSGFLYLEVKASALEQTSICFKKIITIGPVFRNSFFHLTNFCCEFTQD